MLPVTITRRLAHLLDEIFNDGVKIKGTNMTKESGAIYLEEAFVAKMESGFVINANDLEMLILILESYKSKINPQCYAFDGTTIEIGRFTVPFLRSGGFMAIYENEAKEAKFAEQIQEVNNSVIETNKSIRGVNKLFWATLIFAGLGAIFQGLTWWREIQRDKPQKSPQSQNSKQSQEQKLQDSLKNQHLVDSAASLIHH